MRSKILILVLIISVTCVGQNKLSYSKLKNNVIDYLVTNKNLNNENAKKYKTGEYNGFTLVGSINQFNDEELKEGLYQFAPLASNQRIYFTLVENDNFTIIDLSTRQQLDDAITKVLDFCERKSFCHEISKAYAGKLISYFYNTNKNPNNAYDINCSKQKTKLQDLP